MLSLVPHMILTALHREDAPPDPFLQRAVQTGPVIVHSTSRAVLHDELPELLRCLPAGSVVVAFEEPGRPDHVTWTDPPEDAANLLALLRAPAPAVLLGPDAAALFLRNLKTGPFTGPFPHLICQRTEEDLTDLLTRHPATPPLTLIGVQ